MISHQNKYRFLKILLISCLLLGFAAFRFHKQGDLIGLGIIVLTLLYFLMIEKEVRKRTEELETMNRLLQKEVQERQRIEAEIYKDEKELQKRHETLQYLTKFTIFELKPALQQVIERTAKVMEIDRVSVWLYHIENGKPLLSCYGLYVESSHETGVQSLRFEEKNFPEYFKALVSHSALNLPSTENGALNLEMAPYLSAFGIRSKLDTPILFEDNLLGVLFWEETRKPKVWELDDRHFAQSIADIIAIMIEQSEREKAEKALQVSEEKLRFVTQKAIDAILTVNEKGHIISWNLGANKIFGYEEKEILGSPLVKLLPHGNYLQLERSSKPVELQGVKKNGSLLPVEVSYSPWTSQDLPYDTVIIRDITERKEYEKRLIKAMHEAKEANAAKSEFLAIISHELRTPLNSIIGFNQCLLMEMDGPVNTPQKASLQKIEKSSFHLLSLIDDILNLAKIEAHKMELDLSQENIVELIESCIGEAETLAEKKHLTLSFTPPKPFVLLQIDKMKIRQVLLNLLSNAIKFTEKGTITVTLKNEPAEVVISVKDTGIGISKEALPKLFHPFSQGDSSITRRYGGTGLGLAISKKIVELHGGTIEVESEKKVGSLFSFHLPKIQ